MDSAYKRALLMARMIRADPRFSLIFLSPASNVCFFYLPAFIREEWHREVEPHMASRWKASGEEMKHLTEDTPDPTVLSWEKCTLPALTAPLVRFFPTLNRVPGVLYRKMQEDGRMLVNFANLPEFATGLPYFFRVVLHNPLTTTEHLQFILDTLDHLAQDIDWTQPTGPG